MYKNFHYLSTGCKKDKNSSIYIFLRGVRGYIARLFLCGRNFVIYQRSTKNKKILGIHRLLIMALWYNDRK